MSGTMYFSYAPLCLFVIKRSLNHFEQSTVPHEPGEYYDTSGALKFVFTTIQVIDLQFVSVCPSSFSYFFKTYAGPHLLPTSSNAAFAENVHHNIYKRVRLIC